VENVPDPAVARTRTKARIAFSFMVCTAFFGILVKGPDGDRPIARIVAEQFPSYGLLFLTPAALIIGSSFGPARLFKRLGFWVGWVMFSAFVVIANLVAEHAMTLVSSIPFVVSSAVSVIIRVNEKDGT